MADVHGSVSDVAYTRGDEHNKLQDGHNINLSREQYEHVVNLLQHFQFGAHRENSINKTPDLVGGNANFAGPFNEEASGDW
ncbi:hypothetical protein P3S67_004027 [Capsicum chacoense]